jgi:hypothetical protein
LAGSDERVIVGEVYDRLQGNFLDISIENHVDHASSKKGENRHFATGAVLEKLVTPLWGS